MFPEINKYKNASDWLHKGTDDLSTRLRTLIQERGVNPQTSHLLTIFPDDTRLLFGIIATEERQVFQFDFVYHLAHRSFGEAFLDSSQREEDYSTGTFQTWRDITEECEFEEQADTNKEDL